MSIYICPPTPQTVEGFADKVSYAVSRLRHRIADRCGVIAKSTLYVQQLGENQPEVCERGENPGNHTRILLICCGERTATLYLRLLPIVLD